MSLLCLWVLLFGLILVVSVTWVFVCDWLLVLVTLFVDLIYWLLVDLLVVLCCWLFFPVDCVVCLFWFSCLVGLLLRVWVLFNFDVGLLVDVVTD